MNIQTFTTTINCGGCVRAITPSLNAEPTITAWRVDTTTPDKLLTVEGPVTPARVVALLAEAGFTATVAGG